jgi:hypothetical protein
MGSNTPKPEEIEKRRDDALRRALTTPPTPHKAPTKKQPKRPARKPGKESK